MLSGLRCSTSCTGSLTSSHARRRSSCAATTGAGLSIPLSAARVRLASPERSSRRVSRVASTARGGIVDLLSGIVTPDGRRTMALRVVESLTSARSSSTARSTRRCSISSEYERSSLSEIQTPAAASTSAIPRRPEVRYEAPTHRNSCTTALPSASPARSNATSIRVFAARFSLGGTGVNRSSYPDR